MTGGCTRPTWRWRLTTPPPISLYERLGYERQGRPVVERWWRVAGDGSRARVEELAWVMAKRLVRTEGERPETCDI